MNKYITLTLENIDQEHLCCAIADKKHQKGVELKKQWIKSKLNDGHVFRKLDVRGKTFIEYEPLRNGLGANCWQKLHVYLLSLGCWKIQK